MSIKQRAIASLGMLATGAIGFTVALSLPVQAAVPPEPTETVTATETEAAQPTETEVQPAETDPSPTDIPEPTEEPQVAIPAIPAPEVGVPDPDPASYTDPDEGEEVREPLVIDEKNGTIILYPGRMGTCDEEDGTTGVDGILQDACFWPATGTGESFIVLTR